MKKGKGKKTTHACTSCLLAELAASRSCFRNKTLFQQLKKQIWEVADVVEFARLQIIYWIKTLRKSDPFQSRRSPIEA